MEPRTATEPNRRARGCLSPLRPQQLSLIRRRSRYDPRAGRPSARPRRCHRSQTKEGTGGILSLLAVPARVSAVPGAAAAGRGRRVWGCPPPLCPRLAQFLPASPRATRVSGYRPGPASNFQRCGIARVSPSSSGEEGIKRGGSGGVKGSCCPFPPSPGTGGERLLQLRYINGYIYIHI